MTKAAAILAILCTASALQGCDILDILQNKPTKAQRQHEAELARNSISLPADRQPDYAALLGSLQPDQPASPAPVEVAQAQPEPPPADPGPPPFECVSIFRVQTCEDGVLYQLDSNMNWILPGRTE